MSELAGASVLITRPGTPGEQLCAQLHQAGADAWHLPLMEIVAVGDLNSLMSQLRQLQHGDLVIATSRHAVKNADRLLRQADIGWPTDLHYLAVGPSTAEAWRKCGLDQVALPATYNSEGVLQHQWCQQQPGRVLILKGEGGRPLLEHKLSAQGWQVNRAILYRRQIRPQPHRDFLSQWHSRKINAIVVTSTELFDGLWQTLSATPELLEQTPIVVASERIAQHARNKGAHHIWIAQGADNLALLRALTNCYQDNPNLEAE